MAQGETGGATSGKMSASAEASAIFLTDSPAEIKKKVIRTKGKRPCAPPSGGGLVQQEAER